MQKIMVLYLIITSSHTGSTKTRAQTMHKTRTFPIGEFSKARGGNAKRNGRKRKEGKRRGPDEDIQSTASP
jgi:hypothetical protein